MGIAKDLYSKTENQAEWKDGPESSKWPLLDELLDKGYLAYTDYALAAKSLEGFPEANESHACLLCHLSKACRNGHICVKISHSQLLPSIEDAWCAEDNMNETMPQEQAGLLRKMIAQGLASLPPALLAIDPPENSTPKTLLCRSGDKTYFQKYWVYETRVVKELKKLSASTPFPCIDAEMLKNFLAESSSLLPDQKQGIMAAANAAISFISGGPGTGKTFTAGQLIKAIWNSLSPEQRRDYHISLAAPTGKAAANLQKSICQAMGDAHDFKAMKAKTLHSLLEINSLGVQRQTSSKILPADLLLIDESSMIDANIMGILLKAVKPGARIIFLGDRHQLPSIEAGSVFSDLLLKAKTATHLKVCLRAELKAIVDFAQEVNQGNAEEAIRLLSQTPGLVHQELPSELPPRQALEKLYFYAKPFFDIDPSAKSPLELLEAFNAFRILSPLRQGPMGTEEINAFFYGKMAQSMAALAIPIMITKNNYKWDLFNGETGVLIKNSHWQTEYAIFSSPAEPGYRVIPALLLPPYEFAFCMSVHKSQGSEFRHVILLLPQGSQRFGREALYTGATRAKKALELWGDKNTILQTIARTVNRISGIGERL